MIGSCNKKTDSSVCQLPTVIYLKFLYGIHDRSVLRLVSIRAIRSRLEAKQESNHPYGITSLLAGGASMIIILPAVLDLRSNGEELSTITKFKTEATGVFDLVMKI